MDNFTFGLTMLIVGMGGTMLTLYLITLLIKGLSSFFPTENPHSHQPKKD